MKRHGFSHHSDSSNHRWGAPTAPGGSRNPKGSRRVSTSGHLSQTGNPIEAAKVTELLIAAGVRNGTPSQIAAIRTVHDSFMTRNVPYQAERAAATLVALGDPEGEKLQASAEQERYKDFMKGSHYKEAISAAQGYSKFKAADSGQAKQMEIAARQKLYAAELNGDEFLYDARCDRAAEQARELNRLGVKDAKTLEAAAYQKGYIYCLGREGYKPLAEQFRKQLIQLNPESGKNLMVESMTTTYAAFEIEEIPSRNIDWKCLDALISEVEELHRIDAVGAKDLLIEMLSDKYVKKLEFDFFDAIDAGKQLIELGTQNIEDGLIARIKSQREVSLAKEDYWSAFRCESALQELEWLVVA